jgi:Flp pilus assembly protein TadD
MYLPLAAVVAAAVLGGYGALQRLEARGLVSREFRRAAGFGAVSACALLLGTATHMRNDVYATEVSIWADTVAKAPHNARAHVHLANALRGERGDLAERHYRLAVELNPSCSEAHTNLGGLLARSQPEQSVPHLRKALQLKPRNADAHNNLANALARLGRLEEAIGHYRETLRLEPGHPQAQANIQIVLAMQRDGRQGP